MQADFKNRAKTVVNEIRISKALYQVTETADLLSVSRNTVYELIKNGELLCHNRTPGSRGVRVLGPSIRRYIERYILHPDRFME